MSNICMEDTDDAGIPIRMMFLLVLFILVGQNHNVSMCARVHRVLSASHIVCSVIDSKDLVLVYTIVNEGDGASFVVCELVVFSIEFLAKDLSEEVIFEPRKKVLFYISVTNR